MWVDRRLETSDTVAYSERDLRSLRDSDRRSGDTSIIGEHDKRVPVYCFSYFLDPEIVDISIFEIDDLWWFLRYDRCIFSEDACIERID